LPDLHKKLPLAVKEMMTTDELDESLALKESWVLSNRKVTFWPFQSLTNMPMRNKPLRWPGNVLHATGSFDVLWVSEESTLKKGKPSEEESGLFSMVRPTSDRPGKPMHGLHG
jgi:hypothetical protein